MNIDIILLSKFEQIKSNIIRRMTYHDQVGLAHKFMFDLTFRNQINVSHINRLRKM